MNICPTCGSEWPDDTKFCPKDGSTLRSAAGTADMIGTIIADRYRIDKKLGEGGMGAVYLGEHVRMGRKSAIKVMTQAMASDPDAIARFNREAANAARINHPNVCAIYDFGETEDGVIYLAMEFIEGESLSDLVQREGALTLERAFNIAKQTADALQIAHEMGIVHRDLKPDNIMIAPGRGGSDLVKVVDFGIAKAMGGEEGQNVTKTGLVVGTPEYMSPEQLSGDVLDGRSDLYSLGLVLYRMVTGTLPFPADTAQEMMIKRLTDDPLPLNEALPGAAFPDALQRTMDRALARMPSDRYETAVEFANDLTEALEGLPAATPAPSDTEAATQLIDAEEAVQAATAGPATEVLPTRVSGEEGEGQTPDTAQPAAVPAPAAVKKSPVTLLAAGVTVLVLGGGAAAAIVLGGAGNGSGTERGDSIPIIVSDVTSDTAGQRLGGDGSERESDRGRRGDRGDRPAVDRGTGTDQDDPPSDTSGRVIIPPPTVDSAAIFGELGDILELSMEAPSRASARNRAQEIYDNGAVPANLRADAASITSGTYIEEERWAEACRWIKLALQLAPGRTSYNTIRAQINTQTRCTL